MEPQNIKEDLQKIADELPHGAFTEIAKECNCSTQYVSQFFKGQYNLTSDNTKLLDAADKIIEREKNAIKQGGDKINEILSKGKE